MRLSQLNGINNPSDIFKNTETLPQNVTNRILIYAIGLAGIVFFVKIVISGYLYLTSMGDPGKVQAASKNLVNSILGLFIVVLSYFISQIIFAALGIGGVT